MQIEKLSGTESDLELLVNLLKDAVGSGASIGFLLPLNTKAAKDYFLISRNSRDSEQA